MSTILILNAASSTFASVGLVALTVVRRSTRNPRKLAYVSSAVHGAPGAPEA